jgi:methyltransferase (TIGR00027 family)
MTRTDDDTWDIATSVGATAVMVALARAAETTTADPLIRDEFAEPLVSTPELAGVREVASWWTDPDADRDTPDAADDDTVSFQQMIDYQAVRTHFFDAFFASAASAGIRQYVILAAGLDSRAYRLNWPDDTVVYEIDMPAVLEYKGATLNAHGATPTTTRREVAIDLRQDWPAALRAAGFEPARPTAWLAEGLLPFLPGGAQEAMFSAVDGLSSPGSRVAVEVFGVDDTRRQEFEQRWKKIRAAREQRGQQMSFDPFDLWYGNDGRPDCADWFSTHGWATRSVDSSDESSRLGRQMWAVDDERGFFNSFVTAELPK